ncbi:hypothetical protein [Agrobacterium rosae]|uniref:hypothetical protein n=1 Tax=Agrobacterium rosae TaxID=1972867 RepID=UPI00122F20A9|nr:hypothetical protein [Agrobacterium rosae]KAA3506303.1 hypothetical protein DXM21_25305 [Agrobacterium rosae]KAA3510673.1 hypothetical protein DXM25_25395 [Agrobacterium rosae]MQB51388.1 hypothetical protein [Agrobacterium rosae]
MFRNVLLAMAMLLFTGESSTAAPLSDLTIEVGGDLLTYGGVVTIYDIPVSQEAWPTGIGETPTKIRLDSRYAEVQLRYPRGGKFVFRFRPAEGTSDPETFATQVLSVIGTDEKDQGPQMTEGFKDAYSSGGQIIRVLPLKERAGDAEATRTAGRWGETQLYDDPPPADQRSARGLIAVIRDGQKQPHLLCEGDELAQACTIADEQWPALNALWWRAIAEQRLERLRDRALRRCYDSSFFGGGACEPDPESDEPAYLYKNKK